MSQRMPAYYMELKRQTHVLAGLVHVEVARTTQHDGLYVAMRSKRDSINVSRKRKYLSVRLRRGGIEVFRSEEAMPTFPTDHLIAQLMLIA